MEATLTGYEPVVLLEKCKNLFLNSTFINQNSTKSFSAKELACRCEVCKGGLSEFGKNFTMDEDFLFYLQEARELLDKPMVVSSGFRCRKHPQEAEKDDIGPHAQGKAVDILINGIWARRLILIAEIVGFTGIGIMQRGDIEKRFVHLDTCEDRPNRPRPHIWSY